MLHYITVHEWRRTNSKGKTYFNIVDRGFLTFMRKRIIAWTPSRRFEYAMEKAVLLLSDTQLVTGLAILIAGYSQLNCGLSAYHWQMMVYIAWFSSFSFLSAMAFLEKYFQANHSLRIIRVCFMFILASLLIVALLPTGSHNWLNLLPGEGGFYPSLSAVCYFKQIGQKTYNPRAGPKLLSMVVSILLAGGSYIHRGIRLFDPTAELTQKYLRTWPGQHLKRLLYVLERKITRNGIRAGLWTILYLVLFAGFTSVRAVYDISESMVVEIIWFSFAIAWGSIKLWETRGSVTFTAEGLDKGANLDVLEEDYWSFGQTLPLVLLLLPILSMAQVYLDNDAKAADATPKAAIEKRKTKDRGNIAGDPATLSSVHIQNADEKDEEQKYADPRNSTFCSITQRNHYPSLSPACTSSTFPCTNSISGLDTIASPEGDPPLVQLHSPLRSTSPLSTNVYSSSRPLLPGHPYKPFQNCPWYNDHMLLLIGQILMVAIFALFLLTQLSNFLGLSIFLRNRLFLIWILGIVPAASQLHLIIWYLAAWFVRAINRGNWLTKRKQSIDEAEAISGFWKTVTFGNVVYWFLRMFLVAGLLACTFFVSVEIAGPNPLTFDY